MKDITDYFTSPTKANNCPEVVNSTKPVRADSDQNVNTENKIVKDPNMTATSESGKGGNRVKKKKKRRKPTDPEVRNVAELFSSNLSLVSPNMSGSKINSPGPDKKKQEEPKRISGTGLVTSVGDDKSKTKNNENTDLNTSLELDEININETMVNEETSPIKTLAPKVNAFQFLMNSRNNVIGQNSDGKINKEQVDSFSEDKTNLETRKQLFKNWADQKGASKRKREEKEVEKCIDLKMERRAKRLKKFVSGKKEDGEDGYSNKLQLSLKGKKKVKRLSSTESESSNDLIIGKPTLNMSFNVAEVMEENTQDTSIISKYSSSPLKKHKENNKSSLLNFFGVINKVAKEDLIEVFEESPQTMNKEIIKIKMFTPESTRKRSTLLSLNINQAKSVDSFKTKLSSLKNHKCKNEGKKHKKRKHKSRDIEESSQSEPKLNDSMEDFCFPNSNKIEKKGKSEGKHDQKKTRKINLNDTTGKISSAGQNIISEVDDESINHSNKMKSKFNISKQCILVEDSIDLLPKEKKSHDSESKTQCAHKRNVQKKTTNLTTSKQVKHSEVIVETPPEGRTLRKRSAINYNDTVNIDRSKSSKKAKDTNNLSALKCNKSSKDESKHESIEKVDLLSSDSEHDTSVKKKTKGLLKMAPVFRNATPKPKVNPEVIEARKMFLLSGVPDSLKKTVEKQRSIEEKEFDVFPVISHIQQKCESKFWNLSNPDLNYTQSNCYLPSLEVQTIKCENLPIEKPLPYEVKLITKVEKVNNPKGILQKIKLQNPDYPVFKVFRHIYEKSGKCFMQDLTKNHTKKSPKKNLEKSKRKSVELEKVSDSSSQDHAMWIEKYMPRSSEEILGNYHGVNKLKKWLEMWMNYSEEINVRKRKRRNSNSGSEFESTDCDSRDSTRLPGNTVLLYGPCGSGKTSAVYAIANELKFNVLELNASTKRTGKILLQELQEATQSHQVRKNEANSLSDFVNPLQKRNKETKNKKVKDNDKISNSKENKDTKNMCILLLEDIDLIFEQDDGFLSSLSQLIMTSKRPIILTATDNSPQHVQKFISQYECISFMPFSLQCLAIWLQLVCLVEGLLVDKDDMGNLLEFNKGDIRKTLLEVQFWSQSGGQLETNRIFPFKLKISNNVAYLKAQDDEQIDVRKDEADNKDQFVHKHCLGSFNIFRVNKEYCIPQPVNLGTLWWNIPNLLDVPCGAAERLHRRKSSPQPQETTKKNNYDSDKAKLNRASMLYDSLILTDLLFYSSNCNYSKEPFEQNWSVDVLNSLELTERKDNCKGMFVDLVNDLSHTLINGSLEHYRKIDGTSGSLDMAMPDSKERRWRANQHMCAEFLKNPIPLLNTLDRRSIALDYLPTLRDIARSEEKRAASNTKRGNRFRHYLKDFDINFKQSSCTLACNILNIE